MIPIPVFWVKCCTIWPVAPGASIGRCGRCGESPDERVDEPESGKAELMERGPSDERTGKDRPQASLG